LFPVNHSGSAADARWTVRFFSSDAPRLVPPDRSVTDGGDGSVMTLHCLGTPRIGVQLRFDPAMARKVAGLAELYRRARMGAIPVLVVVIVLSIWFGFVDDSSADTDPQRATARTFLVAALSGVMAIGLAAFQLLVRRWRRAIPQYPVCGGGYIFVRNLHPDAANRWVAANNGLIQRIA
jgi:hypothetical protein